MHAAPVIDRSRKITGKAYAMQEFVDGCVDRYCELTGWPKEKIRGAPTPFIDESKDPLGVRDEDTGAKDHLGHIAMKVLMKIMYLARFGRYELLRAIQALATKVTKWDTLCDKKLYRIIQYLVHAREWRMIGFIGDPADELQLGLFTDADFAGDDDGVKTSA